MMQGESMESEVVRDRREEKERAMGGCRRTLVWGGGGLGGKGGRVKVLVKTVRRLVEEASGSDESVP